MSAGEELNTVVDVARKTEIDGSRFYSQSAEKTANPLARKMFESLVEAEERHLKFIEQLAAGEFEAAPYDRGFSRRLTTVFSEAGGGSREPATGVEDDIAALTAAIDMEDKSMAFYRKWSETAADEKVRAFCSRMYAEEEDHWRVLQSTREYLESTGDWYMAQEGWSFDGG
ncbi:MAG: ferritin-like domain-containing protein [Planctomycetota bacterium]|jgi:rubrerythrin